MDTIVIRELEVRYHVGVPDEERVRPQRLLISLELDTDFSRCAPTDDIDATINYYSVTRRLLTFGEGRSWKLIERLAVDVAEMVLQEYKPAAVRVEVQKFILPDTRHVAVQVERRA
jgi:7,8-dihydroneopterin aldolase/epimerase/oxygenase